jgi:hypothetical protein
MFLYYAATVLGAYWIAGRPWRNAARLLATSLLPIAYALALVLALDAVLGHFFERASLVRGALGEVVLLAAMYPCISHALSILRGRA